jgi:hypothetical protein
MTTRLIAALALALALITAPPANATPSDPFDQRSFPCEEDEVLGYSPRFGPDRVGCIHIDEFTNPNAWDMGAYVGGWN